MPTTEQTAPERRRREPSIPPVPAGDTDGGPVLAATAALAQLRAVTAELRDHERAVRRDEPDAVHQARIRIRRLRSLLSVYGPLFGDGIVPPLDHALKRVGKQFGKARDAEVLAQFAESELGEVPDARGSARLHRTIVRGAWRSYRKQHAKLIDRIDAGVFDVLLDALEAAFAAPQHSSAGDRPAIDAMPPLIDAQLDAVLTAAERAGTLGEGEYGPEPRSHSQFDLLHEGRKAGRALRYSAEAAVREGIVAEQWGGARATASKRMQDALGDHRDRSALADRVEALAARDRGKGKAVEAHVLLADHLRHRAARSLATYPGHLAGLRALRSP